MHVDRAMSTGETPGILTDAASGQSAPREPLSTKTHKQRKLPWSFIIAGLAIAGAIAYLVIANTGTTAEYYMTVKELHACTTCATQTVRVSGNVVGSSIERNGKTQVVHFSIHDTSGTLPVVYSGVVPDIFGPNVQVVVEGKVSDGVFQAQNLLTKCPSKFQSATPSTQSASVATTRGSGTGS